jgi:hypothetical protein
MADGIFATWVSVYRSLGLWPRPIRPGSKACYVKDWQLPDTEQPRGRLEYWSRRFADHGIGLLMGSPLPGGLRLGALDVDRDEYVRLAKVLLRDPISGRVGQKGAVLFVRVRGDVGNPEFRVTGSGASLGKVAECLFEKKLCVIPPTIHPVTSGPYQWLGTPLHKVDLNSLPIVGE